MKLKQSILYLDDETACLSLFQETFGNEFDVRIAMTVKEARRLLSERGADIIISDQKMPEIEGTEFLREVAREHPSSCRVLLTGTVGVADVIHQIGSGIVQLFVVKPWTQGSMRQTLERASATSGLHGATRR